ncbi:MAG TPA: hypothetical protein VF217_03805 [Rhodanobacteraceae bacterium]
MQTPEAHIHVRTFEQQHAPMQQAEMNSKTENDSKQQRMARRTAWILGIIAIAMFVLSIVQQLALTHHI